MTAAKVDYLAGFPDEFRERAVMLRDTGALQQRLAKRYPNLHQIQSNSALYSYVQELKRTYLRSSPPLGKIRYCEKISTLNNALGLHTYAVRVQGKRLKAKNELRVASVFKELPEDFLRMIVVHALAHLRHKQHDKAFYRLCAHMEPDYAQLEVDLRFFLFSR